MGMLGAMSLSQVALAGTTIAEGKSVHHEFNHSIEYSKEDYKSPMKESLSGGFRGALIGLGAGGAYHLISYGATGKQPNNSGRVVSVTTGLGFLVGVVYGYVSADNANDRIRSREDGRMEKYGTIVPDIFVGSSLASTSYGLSYSVAL
jgi:hypothetical protein